MSWSIPGAALALSLIVLVTGCGSPGEDNADTAEKADQEAAQTVERPDPAKAGDVTLTVWDQEVRGGQAAQIKQLNQAFQEKYPNVTIKRVAKSFEDLNTTLKRAVSGDKAPDVVQAHQGRPVTGRTGYVWRTGAGGATLRVAGPPFSPGADPGPRNGGANMTVPTVVT